MRILLVDDEIKLTDALSYILKKNNYQVDVANDGETGLDFALSGIYDMIVLDRMLPYKDGITILKEIRKQGITTPVLLLTAKDTVADRIIGLDAGADDYLVKPFATEELLARIRAASRRNTETIKEENISAGNMKLLLNDCMLLIKDKKIKLTLKETHILDVLMNNLNMTITRSQLLDKIWGFTKEVEMNNIETHICYLRRKVNFKDAGLKLETIRGVGYSLKEK